MFHMAENNILVSGKADFQGIGGNFLIPSLPEDVLQHTLSGSHLQRTLTISFQKGHPIHGGKLNKTVRTNFQFRIT